jgi:hypothetical protein
MPMNMVPVQNVVPGAIEPVPECAIESGDSECKLHISTEPWLSSPCAVIKMDWGGAIPATSDRSCVYDSGITLT